jgi:hypothetical protein
VTARAKTQLALHQFAAEVDGKQVVVLAGARFPSDDRVVREHPTLFAPYDPKAKAGVP